MVLISGEIVPNDLLSSAADAATAAIVGLMVGVVFFPIRWCIQWWARRSQLKRTASRDAYQRLRNAQLDSKYLTTREGSDNELDQAKDEDQRRIRRAWEEALDQLDVSPDKSLYELTSRLSDLYRRAPAVDEVDGYNDDRTATEKYVLRLAVSALNYRVKHPLKRLNKWPDAQNVVKIEKEISDCESELDERHELMMKEWRKARDEASMKEQGPNVAAGSEEQP